MGILKDRPSVTSTSTQRSGGSRPFQFFKSTTSGGSTTRQTQDDTEHIAMSPSSGFGGSGRNAKLIALQVQINKETEVSIGSPGDWKADDFA
ncbi:unnamed protein product [Somion occarium]|uniref:Uncharacterized protein n=1 Tax=Somion occarium TaxID=3059160 RepID=A0ABP1D6T0_9APHY